MYVLSLLPIVNGIFGKHLIRSDGEEVSLKNFKRRYEVSADWSLLITWKWYSKGTGVIAAMLKALHKSLACVVEMIWTFQQIKLRKPGYANNNCKLRQEMRFHLLLSVQI